MIEINNKTKAKINAGLVKRTTEKFFTCYKIKNKNISIAFVGDTVMARLNKEYRRKNYPTDILSFAGEGDELGEIIIDYAQIKRQAKKFSLPVESELIFILVHGLLHLIGYDDETEDARSKMMELGENLIRTDVNLKN